MLLAFLGLSHIICEVDVAGWLRITGEPMEVGGMSPRRGWHTP